MIPLLRLFTPAVFAASFVFALGCGSQSPPPSPGSSSSSSAKASPSAKPTEEWKRFPLVGVVREVDKSNGSLVVKHKAIPGFMESMTMRLPLKNAKELEDLASDDEIEAQLEVLYNGQEIRDYRLADVTLTYTPPKSLQLNLATGKVSEKQPLLKVGEPVPDFEMTDQNGRKFRLSELKGKTVAFTFIYTRCPLPNFCPAMDRRFRELAELLKATPKRAENARLISISFDPERDTPDTLAKHARGQGATPPLWTFAAAPLSELQRVGASFGLIFEPSPSGPEIAHNLSTALVAPDGTLARLDVGTQPNSWTAADYLKAVVATLP